MLHHIWTRTEARGKTRMFRLIAIGIGSSSGASLMNSGSTAARAAVEGRG
jgi:hypothetical protein